MPRLLREARLRQIYLRQVHRLFTLLVVTILSLANVPFLGNLLRNSALAHDGAHVTVQPGDTLSQIALRHGTDIATLRRLNNLTSSDYVVIGQEIALPGGAGGGQSSNQSSWGNYKVQAGDSLTKLAVRYGVSLSTLAQTNGLSAFDELYIGQMISIPGGSAAASSANSSSGVHVVQPGEHLGRIALRYGTTAQALMQVNSLVDPSVIIPGQHLALPTGSSGAAAQINYPTTTEKWIDVNLSQQRVTAYNGTQPVNSFIVSSGLPGTPTVTGTFRIWGKNRKQDMYSGNRASGYAYYLDDVEWVQYFHEDYAFHGAYWHNNFGQPMSRGCINMRNADAQWLYNWAGPYPVESGWNNSSTYDPGTLVVVHY